MIEYPDATTAWTEDGPDDSALFYEIGDFTVMVERDAWDGWRYEWCRTAQDDWNEVVFDRPADDHPTRSCPNWKEASKNGYLSADSVWHFQTVVMPTL
jgi:hypothetical protein